MFFFIIIINEIWTIIKSQVRLAVMQSVYFTCIKNCIVVGAFVIFISTVISIIE